MLGQTYRAVLASVLRKGTSIESTGRVRVATRALDARTFYPSHVPCPRSQCTATVFASPARRFSCLALVPVQLSPLQKSPPLPLPLRMQSLSARA